MREKILGNDHVLGKGGKDVHKVQYFQDVEFPSVLVVSEEEGDDCVWALCACWPVEQSY